MKRQNDLMGKLYARDIEKSLPSLNAVLFAYRLAPMVAHDQSVIVFDMQNEYNSLKGLIEPPEAKADVIITNPGNHGVKIIVSSTGAENAFAIGETIYLNPGIYLLTGEVKLDRYGYYKLFSRKNAGFQLRLSDSLPVLQWNTPTTNYLRKQVSFVVDKRRKIRINAGFGYNKMLHRPGISFGKAAIRNIVLRKYNFPTNKYVFLSADSESENNTIDETNLLKNGNFQHDLSSWRFWNYAKNDTTTVKRLEYNKIITRSYIELNGNGEIEEKTKEKSVASASVRIRNLKNKRTGLSTVCNVTSGRVYRLSGSVKTVDSSNLFGARLAFFLPPQKEKQILWVWEKKDWIRKSLTFTNNVSGSATIYFHMGYGNNAATGAFKNIRLEQIN